MFNIVNTITNGKIDKEVKNAEIIRLKEYKA
jgi:hypothetical protein